ncbi:hypothetical protein Pfo_011515 [Paulownia fortunei]|nr:hypothetical protein Pfo_011515 [Paulownia fortunei]
MGRRHVLLATFPAQGHINPALQFAKRLLNTGIQVTFFTSVYAWRRMAKTTCSDEAPKGLHFVAFSDGYDDGLKPGDDGKRYMTEMKTRGTEALRDTLLTNNMEQGRPITFLVYSHLFAWAAEVARAFHIPTALLWIEPATVLDIYYYYFNGYGDDIDAGSDEIQLPRLPLLSKLDLPSFLLPSSPQRFRLLMKEKLETLDAEKKPKVLVNTFDALEPDAIKAIDKYDLIAIGPLLPSEFLDGKNPSARSFGGDLFETTEDNCLEWLNTKPQSSVVYVSFGSLVRFPKAQMEEIANGLLDCGRPFLWVIRVNENEEQTEEEEVLNCLEELERVGKIVTWCSQLEVLTHPSLGCFVSHCGWNSSLESIAFGVPVVAFAQWFDQGTNAKLIEDVWGTGVRVKTNEEGSVDRDEIRRCIEKIMDGGAKSLELRENARKWNNLAREAMEETGSSDKNLKAFLEEVGDA